MSLCSGMLISGVISGGFTYVASCLLVTLSVAALDKK